MENTHQKLTLCPYCGSYIMESAQFCRQCGEKVGNAPGNFTTSRPTFSNNQGQNNLYPRVRPLGISIISIGWIFGAILTFAAGYFNVINTAQILSKMSPLYNPDNALETWANWAVPFFTVLWFCVILIGFAQLFLPLGFWRGDNWAYKFGKIIPLAGLTIIVLMLLTEGAYSFSLATSEYSSSILIATIFVTVYLVYFRRANVKRWFNADF